MTTMRKLLSTLLLLLVATPLTVLAQNKYPIVLVHGLNGWGRDELLGLKYWGSIQGDLQEQLKAQGYTVYTAVVGPYSSNWDRACELYAQIKGGQVDYGLNHSTTHGHKRFGRTFPGLYAQWGDVVDGKVNKVHLLGHSMGGQTIRMLTQLLNKGSAGAPEVEDASTHPLFAGGKDWVHSITTISTPNQGMTLFAESGEMLKNMFASAFAVLNIGGSATTMMFDAKLDQWGLGPKAADESFDAYLARVFSSNLFGPGIKDFCLWSLSIAGAAEENAWVKTLPNVFYYSYSTVDTHGGLDLFMPTSQQPNLLTMSPSLQAFAIYIGGSYAPNHGLSTSWQANDGVVNTISMSKDSSGELVDFNGVSQKGKWNHMPLIDHMDHDAITGLTLHTQVMDLYSAHAQLLASLPVTGNPTAAATKKSTNSLIGAVTNILGPVKSVLGLVSVAAQLTTAAASVKTVADLEKICATPLNTYAKNYCTSVLSNVRASAKIQKV